jgi:fatty acid desaturase
MTTTQLPHASGSSFTALTRQVHELGLMRRRYAYYWLALTGALAATVVWVLTVVWIGDSWWQLAAAAVLAVIMTQVAFLGHDAAHRQIFRSGRLNDWVSLLVANLLVGISYGWWQHKHTRHHGNPNKVGSDPDVRAGALAYTAEQATRSRHRAVRWLVAHQGWYFFPLLLLEGLSLHANGVRRVASPRRIDRRWVEMGLLTIRLAGLPVLLLLVMSPAKALAALALEVALFGLYMGLSFAPNHIGMPLVAPGLKLDFLSRQVLMSRNLRGGWWVSVLFGGLNHQTEHHLFPSMARPHLRLVQPLVVAHCAALGLPYTQTTLRTAYAQVVTHLNSVGLKDNDPFLCPLVASRRAVQVTDGPGALPTGAAAD